jgi:hypothetical protein
VDGDTNGGDEDTLGFTVGLAFKDLALAGLTVAADGDSDSDGEEVIFFIDLRDGEDTLGLTALAGLKVADSLLVGLDEGFVFGLAVGFELGCALGFGLGLALGFRLGFELGFELGLEVG